MRIALLGAIVVASVAGVSAHVVRGLVNPTLATAFVSSPSAAADAPIKIMWGTQDTGLRVVCFSVANTSPPRVDDADWPRIMAVGFELPGSPSGFLLLEPLGDDWEILEGRTAAIGNRGPVVLDLAIVARVNPARWFPRRRNDPRGIPPGQPATRGSGLGFCVSGPFPDTLPDVSDPSRTVPATIEAILNGVVVSFHEVEPDGPPREFGLWENPLRTVPLYLE